MIHPHFQSVNKDSYPQEVLHQQEHLVLCHINLEEHRKYFQLLLHNLHDQPPNQHSPVSQQANQHTQHQNFHRSFNNYKSHISSSSLSSEASTPQTSSLVVPHICMSPTQSLLDRAFCVQELS